MRNVLVFAVALTAVSATGARADEWCGYASHKDAVVECGYLSAAACADAVGKGGMCFVDPDVAQNATHTAPLNSTTIPPRG